MRRATQDGPKAGNAGVSPKPTPAGTPVVRVMDKRPTAVLNRCRSVMCCAFWSGSAGGAILHLHEPRVFHNHEFAAGRTALVGPTLATTYVRVEPDGTKTYRTVPCLAGNQSKFSPRRPIRRPQRRRWTALVRARTGAHGRGNFRYTVCSLSPKSDETYSNPQSVNVALSLSPPLRAGDDPKISVDGTVVNAAGALNAILELPDRGSHNVNAQVMDRFGKSGVLREHDVSRAAPQPEFSDPRSTASAAATDAALRIPRRLPQSMALWQPCLAGDRHGR